MTGATVTGIDLTPEFVETARLLSDRVGLGGRTEFRTTAGESMPLDDKSFDAAVMVHVGMNVPDKTAVFAEVHRVLRPGGRFALYEQVRTGEGELPYPLPVGAGRSLLVRRDRRGLPRRPRARPGSRSRPRRTALPPRSDRRRRAR